MPVAHPRNRTTPMFLSESCSQAPSQKLLTLPPFPGESVKEDLVKVLRINRKTYTGHLYSNFPQPSHRECHIVGGRKNARAGDAEGNVRCLLLDMRQPLHSRTQCCGYLHKTHPRAQQPTFRPRWGGALQAAPFHEAPWPSDSRLTLYPEFDLNRLQL